MLIFHRGAKTSSDSIKTGGYCCLQYYVKTNDRAIFTFKNSQEIVDNKELLLKFIAKWLEHI
jgi:hypothetical protein